MATREIAPMLQKMREVLLGRKHMNNQRFPQVMATRDWDKVTPNLPPGPSHKLADNGYYTRDGRREVHPPTVLADGTMVIIQPLQTGALRAGDSYFYARKKQLLGISYLSPSLYGIDPFWTNK